MEVKSPSPLISHKFAPESLGLEGHRKRLIAQKGLTLSLEEELGLLDELSQFELGQFLLNNKGFNGYWTAYAIIHGPKKNNLSPLEGWLLHSAPTIKATQERFQIFKQKIQSHLTDGMSLASLPCGLMDDLLTLDYTRSPNTRLTGIDLDQESLDLAEENAKKNNSYNTIFLNKDAWSLGLNDEFNIVTSNGLNIYEPDDSRVIDFYKQVYASLKQRGIFITSFLTPPPTLSTESPWKNVNRDDAIKQKAIFADIIQAGWQVFRTEAQTIQQLKAAGFEIVEFVYDNQAIFPTVVARKA